MEAIDHVKMAADRARLAIARTLIQRVTREHGDFCYWTGDQRPPAIHALEDAIAAALEAEVAKLRGALESAINRFRGIGTEDHSALCIECNRWWDQHDKWCHVARLISALSSTSEARRG